MQHQMGIVFDINNKEQVAAELNTLLRNTDLLDEMRRNAWKAARDIYNWENSSIEFGKVLSRCEL
jgi:glycosyltransferase involved in cell wall biosynthesis